MLLSPAMPLRFDIVLTVARLAALLADGAQAAPLKIGASLPITGGFSIAGAKHKQGYELCVGLINEKGGVLGRKIELTIPDNRSDPATAINQDELTVLIVEHNMVLIMRVSHKVVVMALVHNGHPIIDSAVILEYLEDVLPDVARLHPVDPRLQLRRYAR